MSGGARDLAAREKLPQRGRRSGRPLAHGERGEVTGSESRKPKGTQISQKFSNPAVRARCSPNTTRPCDMLSGVLLAANPDATYVFNFPPSIFGGSNEIQRTIIAGAPRAPNMDVTETSRRYHGVKYAFEVCGELVSDAPSPLAGNLLGAGRVRPDPGLRDQAADPVRRR